MPYLLALLFVLLSGTLSAQAGAEPDPVADVAPQLKNLIDVFSVVEREAADPVDLDVAFYQGAIPSMLRTLDPHSSFFDPDQFQQLQQMEQSEQKGFGSIVSVTPGRVIVLQTLPGTPSAKAGLSAGDEIVAVNNIAIARLDPEQIVQVLGASRQKAGGAVYPPSRRLRRGAHHHVAGAGGLRPRWTARFCSLPASPTCASREFEQPTGKLVQGQHREAGRAHAARAWCWIFATTPAATWRAAIETASLFLDSDQLIFTSKGRSSKTRGGAREEIQPAVHLPHGDSGQRENRQRLRDRLRSAAGSRPRRHSGRSPPMARAWCSRSIRFRPTPAWR